ncbi:MAG: Spy/CpxP family protein refolding chaperone [Pseudomonadota bacterium]
MNALRKSIAVGLTVLGMACAAHADEGRHGFAANKEAMQEKMADHFAKRQAKLHDLLKLTAAQESSWATYQAAIKPAAGSTPHPDRAAIAAMSAPQRMEQHLAMAKTHITTMEAHLAALSAFYGGLTAEQKKVFDDNVMGGAHGPHHMMHRMSH